MSNNENQTTTTDAELPATNEGKRGPRVVRARDEVIADLKEDIAALQAKLAKLEADKAAEEQLEALTVGDAVSFVYGRADSRRIESGHIIAAGRNDRGVFQFNVLTDEGLTSETKLIGAAAIVPPGMTGEEFLASLPVYEPKPKAPTEETPAA